MEVEGDGSAPEQAGEALDSAGGEGADGGLLAPALEVGRGRDSPRGLSLLAELWLAGLGLGPLFALCLGLNSPGIEQANDSSTHVTRAANRKPQITCPGGPHRQR